MAAATATSSICGSTIVVHASSSSFDTLRLHHRRHAFQSVSASRASQLFRKQRCSLSPRFRVFVSNRKSRVACQSKTVDMDIEVRKCSPFLESTLLNGERVLGNSSNRQTVGDIWSESAEKYGDFLAVEDPYHNPPSSMSYKQIEQEILNFSEGLRVIGIKPEEKVALFADNSCRWLVADQGLMAIGAINVVRGSRSPNEELLHIYDHSESVGLAVDNPELLNRMAESFYYGVSIRFIILLWGEKSSVNAVVSKRFPVYHYQEIIDMGQTSRKVLLDSHDARGKYVYEAISTDSVATIVYTSGTTGNPKGVMLTHGNLLHQIRNFDEIVPAEPGDTFLSMLPTWHAYERACEYYTFTTGTKQVYTNLRKLKDDLKDYKPQFMISVPLVFETLYSAIQKQIASSNVVRKVIALMFLKISMAYMELTRIHEGKYLTKKQQTHWRFIAILDCLCARILAAILQPFHRLANKLVYSKMQSAVGMTKAGVSGGGSLPLHVDRFFEAIGVKLQNGYGLTECSPVVAARRPTCNVLGSIGPPLRETEFKVVDPESGEVLPHGSKGVIKVKGPQVMKGYYKNPVAAKQVLDEEGWLNTGDIGWIAPHHSTGRSRRCGGFVVLEGRAKDTIVLSTGENVEPSEIEDAALRSKFIQQIVVFGQDRRRLGAIIVPNKEEILLSATGSSDSNVEVNKEKMMAIIDKELRTWTSKCSFQVGPILLVDEPFTIEDGLMTPTMKIRRDKVAALYRFSCLSEHFTCLLELRPEDVSKIRPDNQVNNGAFRNQNPFLR